MLDSSTETKPSLNGKLRLSRTGALFERIATDKNIISTQRLSLGGARAMAMAMAMSPQAMAMAMSPQAMAMAMSPQAMAMSTAGNGTPVPSFGAAVLSTWQPLRELYLLGEQGDATEAYPFENLDIALPPGIQKSIEEIEELLILQDKLKVDRQRQAEIIRQITSNNPVDLLRPLGISSVGGYEASHDLLATILQLSERVGYVYKTRYMRPRPSALDPRIRPFLDNPPHPAYPSNHAFQSFCVAQVFSRIIPEISATTELFHVAQRIGENREWAGLHYESDTEAGEQLARQFTPYLLHACRNKVRAVQREWY